jgi:hypothetical protein
MNCQGVDKSIKGADSMTVMADSFYGQENYSATDEIFISFYLKIAALPSGRCDWRGLPTRAPSESYKRRVRFVDGGKRAGRGHGCLRTELLQFNCKNQ